MNLAIDLDDVTVSITQALIDNHNSLYKTNFAIEDHYVFDLYTIWNCTPEAVMEEVYAFYRSSQMDVLPPMARAVDAIKILSQTHTLHFITSRPQFLEQKTDKWIKRHFPDMDYSLYMTNQYTPESHEKKKKSDICKQIDASLIIEDSPANIADCVSEGIQVLMYDRPWNRIVEENEKVTRVGGWYDILEKIKELE